MFAEAAPHPNPNPAKGGRGGTPAPCEPSQRDAAAFLGGPIAGVVDLDRLKGQREIGEWLPPGRGAFQEILDFLDVTARPFFLEADVLPSGFPVDLFGDVDAG